jgi:hypothetical protein
MTKETTGKTAAGLGVRDRAIIRGRSCVHVGSGGGQ